jgi:hypothetical protein
VDHNVFWNIGQSACADWREQVAAPTDQITNEPIGVGTKYRSSEKITISYGAHTEIVAYDVLVKIKVAHSMR